ncbi:MAG: hypothetical protein ACREBR_04310 [bacterium]
MALSISFYKYLFNKKDFAEDFSSVSGSIQNNVHRALSVLGSVCQHSEKGIDRKNMTVVDEATSIDPTTSPFLDPSSLTWENLSNTCFAAFSHYLKKRDEETKCAAFRGVTGLFIARPRVMLFVERIGLIGDAISNDAHLKLQLEAVRCWIDMLRMEEWRVESGEAKQSMESNNKITLSRKISGDQDGDASIVGSVLTQHSRRLCEMTTSRHPAIRLAVVDLLGHLLRQGLVNAMETVPYLLALQGDVANQPIRSLALKLLVTEGEKRPDMLRQRVCAGVRQAYKFQRLVNSSSITAVVRDSTLDSDRESVQCIFGPIA